MSGDSQEFDEGRPAEDGQSEPVIRDKRRIDPETGRRRETEEPEEVEVPDDPRELFENEESGELAAARSEAAERLEDLQRLQAEYVNYRKRVDRDRTVASDVAVAGVVEALIPVLDEIELARTHDELTGPFAAVAEKLEATLGRFGAERYGAVGEEFDPTVHDAFMHSTSPDVTTTTVVQVLQPGYRIGDRIIRAARVEAADPE